jgi:urease accessory protein
MRTSGRRGSTDVTISLTAADRRERPVADTLILDYARRCAGAFSATGLKGGAYDLALDQPGHLTTDDVLELDDGTLLEVVAAAEPLIEARAADPSGLMRLAWHLGDRHVPVQVLPNRVRLQREPVFESLLQSLGAKLTLIEAPFEPEGGAYAVSHGRGHDHAHEHGHGHHDHHHDH